MFSSGEATARILVVDDEHSIVDAVSTALRYEQFDVATASTGRSALDAVRAAPVDLVVLDVMLPDLDGFEVARRMRDEGITTPILFLTAKSALEDKTRAFDLGADDYVADVLTDGRSSLPLSSRQPVATTPSSPHNSVAVNETDPRASPRLKVRPVEVASPRTRRGCSG